MKSIKIHKIIHKTKRLISNGKFFKDYLLQKACSCEEEIKKISNDKRPNSIDRKEAARALFNYKALIGFIPKNNNILNSYKITSLNNTKMKFAYNKEKIIYKEEDKKKENNQSFLPTIPLRKKVISNISKYSYNQDYLKIKSKNRSCKNIFSPNSNLIRQNFSFNSSNNSSTTNLIDIKSIMSNEIFDNLEYDNLVYDEDLIFNRQSHYEELINESILKFANEKINNNFTQKINAQFHEEFELELSSIKITLISHKHNEYTTNNNSNNNKKNKNNNNNLKFDFIIPFSIIPIFYGYKLKTRNKISINEMKILFSLMIKFSPNFAKIDINDEPMFNYLEQKIKYEDENNYNGFRFSNQDEKDNHKYYYEEIIFPWITPVFEYNVYIEMPKIKFTFKSFNIEVEKFINFELLFFLYEQKFVNWEFYVINYLITLKKFRTIYTKLSTKSEIILQKNSKYFLDTFIHKLDVYNYEKNNELLFIETNNNKNIIYKLTCLQLKFIFKNENNTLNNSTSSFNDLINKVDDSYIISLNMKEMQKIYEIINKISDPINFIKRFIDVQINEFSSEYKNKYIIFFDREKLKNFEIEEPKIYNDNYNESKTKSSCDLNQYFIKDNVFIKTKLNNISKKLFDDYTLELIHPKLLIFNKGNDDCQYYRNKTIKIKEQYGHNLFKNNIFSWPYNLIKFIKENQINNEKETKSFKNSKNYAGNKNSKTLHKSNHKLKKPLVANNNNRVNVIDLNKNLVIKNKKK